MFWFMLGAVLALFIKNNFETQDVIKDVKKIARAVRKAAGDLVRAVRDSAEKGRTESRETRKDVPPQKNNTYETAGAYTEQPESPGPEELPDEAELNAGMAAMLANIPTIDFPKDDPKYDSAKKYMYA